MLYHRNINGHFSSSFDLQSFPFDQNSFRIRFNGAKLRDGRPTNADDVQLVPGTRVGPGFPKASPFLLTSQRIQEHIPEYELTLTLTLTLIG